MTLRVLRSVLNGTPHFGCGVFRAAQKARGAFGGGEGGRIGIYGE